MRHLLACDRTAEEVHRFIKDGLRSSLRDMMLENNSAASSTDDGNNGVSRVILSQDMHHKES